MTDFRWPVILVSVALMCGCAEPDIPDLGPPMDGAFQSQPPQAPPAH